MRVCLDDLRLHAEIHDAISAQLLYSDAKIHVYKDCFLSADWKTLYVIYSVREEWWGNALPHVATFNNVRWKKGRLAVTQASIEKRSFVTRKLANAYCRERLAK